MYGCRCTNVGVALDVGVVHGLICRFLYGRQAEVRCTDTDGRTGLLTITEKRQTITRSVGDRDTSNGERRRICLFCNFFRIEVLSTEPGLKERSWVNVDLREH